MTEYICEHVPPDYEWDGGYDCVYIRKAELIRCEDCVFWKYYCRVVDGVESDHVCSIKRELDGLMHRTKADDFCSWAERKEDAEIN